MRMILVIVVLIVALGLVGNFARMMNPFSMVVAIVAIGVFGGVLREYVKGGDKKPGKGETTELSERIARIEADIADIKEQIADFIISQI